MKLPVHYLDEKTLELRMAVATLDRLADRASETGDGERVAPVKELTLASEKIKAAWRELERLQQSEEADWAEAKQCFEESLVALTEALRAAIEVIGDPLEARGPEAEAPQAQLFRS